MLQSTVRPMRIYFDHNATTPVAPPVADAVGAGAGRDFGNASSVHHFGQQGKGAARRRTLASWRR